MKRPHPHKHAVYLGASLGLAVGIAAFLRLYSLPRQSIWIDEYIILAALQRASLWQCLQTTREWFPDAPPLAYLSFYCWKTLLGSSTIVALRLLPCIPGLLLLPLIFLAGRRLFGVAAALTALYLLTLSPTHIFISQAIRQEAWAPFFSILSIFCFLYFILDQRPYWLFFSLLASIIAMWVHSIAVFLLPAQGLVLL